MIHNAELQNSVNIGLVSVSRKLYNKLTLLNYWQCTSKLADSNGLSHYTETSAIDKK